MHIHESPQIGCLRESKGENREFAVLGASRMIIYKFKNHWSKTTI